MSYYQMNEKLAIDYVKGLGFFSETARLVAREVGDGNLNLVFIIRDEEAQRSLVLKQALPYVRVVGEGWPLSVERTIFEANALEIHNKLVADYAPKLIHRNDQLALIAMEDLSHLQLMRYGMIEMKKHANFPQHISTFLANTLFYTSDLYMDPEEKKKLAAKFVNTQLCKISEDLIFTDPYYDAERNNINPELRPYLEEVFWKKDYLWLEASKLKYKFMTEGQSLLHGDLHTGSIFAGEDETKVFDSEFAFFGPAAFDVGKIIGNFLINYVSWWGKDVDINQIKDYREYLLNSIVDIYNLFHKKFIDNWERDAQDISVKVEGYQQQYIRRLFVDAIGFCGAVMIRRTHGLAHNIDVDGIEDLKKRSKTQIRVLELGEKLIMNREAFKNIEEVVAFVKDNLGLEMKI
ncbi:S-methyl-5-thioribose kinase [Alkaliphilus serpentinus]|uniref:S-methyl-5-thioribose kinase n=1 Tax=Alkaliphilus serpentinus TaxID=1482731 RepID=A0A833HN94_9FIRM|nr:S-methyl-5-thioribose kinase [Alkaliphilus serpentinus]KAB3529199.1 S-methyl-5-thioribose kinase [Alkaliphilus serpentinus]